MFSLSAGFCYFTTAYIAELLIAEVRICSAGVHRERAEQLQSVVGSAAGTKSYSLRSCAPRPRGLILGIFAKAKGVWVCVVRVRRLTHAGIAAPPRNATIPPRSGITFPAQERPGLALFT